MATKEQSDVDVKAPVERRGGARGLSPFEEYERFLEEFLPSHWMRPMRLEHPLWDRLAQWQPRLPRVDVIDQDKQIVVRAEVPGVDRKDLDVSVTDNTVTIKGHSEYESKEEEGAYYRREISRGAFERTVALPCEVNADKAKARFDEGVLELTLPKVQEANRRRIKVE